MTELLLTRSPELQQKFLEHLLLTGVSTALATLLGAPLGVLAARTRWLQSPVMVLSNTVQTIPSLAMLSLLLPLMGIGLAPALTALTLYALLPIVRNTLVGIQTLPSAVLEAADGLGMTRWQRLWWVELPLIMPLLIAGVRTAAVIGVGIATLSAFIGAGGLGDFINRGLALNNTNLVLLGAIPAALLAVLVDQAFGLLESALKPGRKSRRLPRRALAYAAALTTLIIGWVGVRSYTPKTTTPTPSPSNATIRIGSKNFTEQLLIAEIVAQLIERRANLRVERKLNLGGSNICHEALVRGDIDLYVEYTGTALMSLLGEPQQTDPHAVLQRVRQIYAERFNLVWLEPLGFNNTYTMTVRRADAVRNGWRTISDLKPVAHTLRAGFSPEFLERPDGYPGFQKHYGIRYGDVFDMHSGLMYQALAQGEVDVISAYSTDGRIPAFNLQVLEDDLQFFPPYQAAVVIRAATLQRYPELRAVLRLLEGRIDDATMQRLNYAVDEQKRAVPEVAREFLEQLGL